MTNKKITFSEKIIERANRNKKEFAALYDVSESNVIWLGNEQFIIIKNGEEIRIGF